MITNHGLECFGNTGQLCVYLFKRHDESPTVAKDSLLTNKVGGTDYWTFTPKGSELWPAGSWERIRLEMTFNGAPYTILAGDRLGVALSVERSITSRASLMYDAIRYVLASRGGSSCGPETPRGTCRYHAVPRK